MKCPECGNRLIGSLKTTPENFAVILPQKEIHQTAEVWLYCKPRTDARGKSIGGCGWVSTRRFNIKEWL